MKPIKQTVYFLKEEVNIEENYYLQDLNGEFYLEQEGYFFTPEQLNEYTKNVIKEALEIAAENAVIEDIGGIGRDGEYYEHNIVNEKSITNTFEETFNKFKV